MKFKASLTELIVGILGLISFSSIYMSNPTFSYYIPLIFCFIIVILTSVFELFSYYNKIFYQLTVILVLVLM